LAQRLYRLGDGESDEIKLDAGRSTQIDDDILVLLNARRNDDDDVVGVPEDGMTRNDLRRLNTAFSNCLLWVLGTLISTKNCIQLVRRVRSMSA
jgi:hypothetical protein